MKMTYKIVLIVAVFVCVLAVVMFTGPSEPAGTEDTSTDTATASGVEEEAAPRKSLRSDMSEAGQESSTAGKPVKKDESTAGKSLAQDVRNRMRAVGSDQSEKPVKDTPVKAVSADAEDKPIESAGPDAIALARTDNNAKAMAEKPESKTAPAISRADLDAILGITSDDTAKSQAATTEITDTDKARDDTQADKKVIFAGGTYVVQPNDTFSSIAIKLYGEESRWVDISRANFVDPTKLQVGQELRIPALQALSEPEPSIASNLPEGVKTYTIRPGDSLSTVAKTFYGDPTLWRVIYNYNSKKIGDNPNAIQAGMTLEVPPRVTGAR